jgi:proliferating cell nuclear antigen PCNA
MLEAQLKEAVTLKRLLDGKSPSSGTHALSLTVFYFLRRTTHAGLYTAIKELVTDANFECTEDGIKLQAMDNSHVALVAVELKTEGFVLYRCDRPMPLGVNLASLTKVLKCAKDDDRVELTAADAADVLKLKYEAKSTLLLSFLVLRRWRIT